MLPIQVQVFLVSSKAGSNCLQKEASPAAPGFIIAVENAGIDTLGNPGIEIGVVRGGSDDKFGIFGKAVGGGRAGKKN